MSAAPPPLGSLRDRVTLFSKQTVVEADGGEDTTYVPLATVWARVTATTPRRDTFADAVASAVSHTVVLRHRTDIAAGDRLVWRGRTLEVIGAEDLNGRRAYTVIRCAETVTAG